MRPNYLASLSGRHGTVDPDSIDPMRDLLDKYQQYKNSAPLDLAAVAIRLGEQPVDGEAIDPLALKALHATNPNFDPDMVGSYSDDAWMGIVNTAKGKYFEYLVADRLSRGETVGDLTLPAGYSARLADSMNQPGWDMQIVDTHGDTAELLQLKATESASYIYEALRRYPDIRILSTTDVVPAGSMLIDSKMSEQDLESAINATAEATHHGYLDSFWENFHPLIPLLIIAGTQGYRIVLKKQTVSDAAEIARARVTRSLVASASGAVFKTLTGSWLVSAFGAITVGMFFDRAQNIDELLEALRSRNALLEARKVHYQNLMLQA